MLLSLLDDVLFHLFLQSSVIQMPLLLSKLPIHGENYVMAAPAHMEVK